MVPLNISRFSAQAALPAPDRGLRQILAKYLPNCKLSENLPRSVLYVIIFSDSRLLFPGRHADFEAGMSTELVIFRPATGEEAGVTHGQPHRQVSAS